MSVVMKVSGTQDQTTDMHVTPGSEVKFSQNDIMSGNKRE